VHPAGPGIPFRSDRKRRAHAPMVQPTPAASTEDFGVNLCRLEYWAPPPLGRFDRILATRLDGSSEVGHWIMMWSWPLAMQTGLR
jgi:hypothetical protein